MNSISHLTLEKAENEVKDSTAQLEVALTHLKEKVDDGMYSLQRFIEASKNPPALLGMAFVVGIFFGQMIRLSYKKEESSEVPAEIPDIFSNAA